MDFYMNEYVARHMTLITTVINFALISGVICSCGT